MQRALSRTVLVVILCASVGLAGVGVGAAAAEEPAPTVPAEPPAPTIPEGFAADGPELAVGATGADVAMLQWRLAVRGFWQNDASGVFGQATRHAVVAYQKFYDLPRTGRVDAWTRISLALLDDHATPQRGREGRVIEVDLRRQVMVVSTDGVTNWVFDISSGKSSTKTPKGNFRIGRQIDAMRRSRLGTLWRPKYFTGGYALHGSPSVPAQPASHGCIRMTNAEINELWASGLAPIGTPVIVY